jgi:hypothetical protein
MTSDDIPTTLRKFKCYECKEILPETSFHKDQGRGGPRDVAGKCKKCKSAYHKELRTKNPEKFRVRAAAQYEKAKDQHKAAMAKWRLLNKDKMLQYWHNYKAKQRANGPIDEDINILALIERDNGICQICEESCLEDPSIDHKRPVSKGGTHTWDNIQLAHRICNIKKGVQYASAS